MNEERIRNAIRAALVSRGPNKGMLKAQAPRYGTDGYAAWQALELVANPWKVSIGGLMMLSPDQRELYQAIVDRADNTPGAFSLDRDRVALESMGAW